ncbi:MAG: hypothetical protein IJO96_02750 [Oscillospiraceae bacterium]|nr:hypothetical protein [Oscillospiraceae bacterium]
MRSEESIVSGLLQPHHDYRPAVMWFWNDDLQEREITAQLEGFCEKGVNDFFVNHVWGATDRYLGERFFEVIKHTVKEAKRLGLNFWIYDELNWPSGIAGGYLLKDHPETKGKVLQDTKFTVGQMARINDAYIKGEFVCAQMIYRDDRKGGAEDVTDKVKIEKNAHGFWVSFVNDGYTAVDVHVISTRLQESVEAASRMGSEEPGYVDGMDEKAMRAFIDYTHEKYKQAVGEEFGKTVKGIFTDEIAIGSPHEIGRGVVPWNDSFAEKFQKRFGYELTPWFYALVEKPATAKEKQVRWNYWQLAGELFRDAHVKQVYEWCDKENLKYTGHFDGEESMLWCVIQSGDIFEQMKYQHIPGIDSIYSRTEINNENFNTAGKIVSSCAKFYNRERTLCETYTVSSGKLRFDEMRRIANRLMVLGVNMIQYMGAKYSWNNARKLSEIAAQPSHNYHNSLFEHYDLLGNYMGRVQYVSAKTKPNGRTLLMWPDVSTIVNVDLHKNPFQRRNDEDMRPFEITEVGLVNALLELNIEYDLFSEWLADDISAENGVAKLYSGEYDTVILPYVGETTDSIMKLVKRLNAAGVRLVFANELPQLAVDTGVYQAPFGKTPEKLGLTQIAENVVFIKNAAYEETMRGKNAHFREMLEEAVGKGKRTLDIRHNGDIYTGKRKGEDAEVVFLCNDSDGERSASIAYREGMQLVDPDRCTVKKLIPAGGRADIHFDPYQMYILIESEDKVDWEEEEDLNLEPVKKLNPCCDIKVEKGNPLVMDWRFAPCEYDGGEIVLPGDDKLIPLNDEWVPGRYAKLNATCVMVCDFEVETVPKEVTLFAEYKDVLRCELNGERIDDKWSPCRLWGVYDASMNAASMLKEGKNRIVMVFKMPDHYVVYRAPYIMLKGDFEADYTSIKSKRPVYQAAPVNGQGYPRFCGTAVYSFEENLTAEEAAKCEYLAFETRDAAEVLVNGRSAGVRLWNPNRYCVKGMLKEGANKIEIKTTSPMWNHFCPKGEDIDVGLLEAPKLEAVKN